MRRSKKPQHPANRKRAQCGAVAMRAYRKAKISDNDSCLEDLLCDLIHWADSNQRNFLKALVAATKHYAHEIKHPKG